MAVRPWISPRAAIALQDRLRSRVIEIRPDLGIRTVAGVDCAFPRGSVAAAVAVLSWPDLEIVETATAIRPLDFPYVPGLLAFRELPAILEAQAKLVTRPDVLITDGQGRAHQRRFGLACHLGLELDLPTIGCGKSRLVGTHRPPARRRGSCTTLYDRGDVVGKVLRTRAGVRPVYVSVGHRMDLPTAVRIVLSCCPRYRLPEPIRAADTLARSLRGVSRPGRG